MIDEPVDAFGDGSGLKELLRSSTALANPGNWLDIIYERCLQSLQISTSLPLVVNPLVDLANHLSLSTKRSNVNHYISSLNLINLILEIIRASTEPQHSRSNGIQLPQTEALSRLIRDELVARMPTFREMFKKSQHSVEAKSIIGSIAIRLGTNLESDENWQREFNHCSASAGVHIAIIAANRYSQSRQWVLWARDIMVKLCPLDTLNEAQVIQLTAAWCILLELDAVESDESSQAAKHVYGRRMSSVIECFGEKAQVRAGLRLLALESDIVAALTMATDLLVLAFAPHYVRTSVRSAREAVDIVLYPPQAPARISNLRPDDLSLLQKELIKGLAGCSVLFRMKSNVWPLWGLPETQASLVAFSSLLG
jgi:hypothetical protein